MVALFCSKSQVRKWEKKRREKKVDEFHDFIFDWYSILSYIFFLIPFILFLAIHILFKVANSYLFINIEKNINSK